MRLSNNAPYRPDFKDSTRPASTTTKIYIIPSGQERKEKQRERERKKKKDKKKEKKKFLSKMKKN